MIGRLLKRDSTWIGDVKLRANRRRRVSCQLIVGSLKVVSSRILILLLRDITEEKASEETFRKSDRYYRSLIESQTDLICRVDCKGRILFANAAYCRKHGKRPRQLLGKTFYRFLPRKDVPRVRQVLLDLALHPHRAARYADRAKCADGMRWLEWEDRAIPGKDGKVAEIQCVGRDVTEHKKIMQSLAESLKINLALLDATQNQMFLCDRNGNILAANEKMAADFGTTCEKLTGKVAFELLPPELAASRKAMFKRVLRTGTPIVHHDTRKGHRLEHRVTPIVNDAGKVVQVAVSTHDITDITAFQGALERKTLAMEEVLAHVQEQTKVVQQSFVDNLRHVVLPLVYTLRDGLPGTSLAKWEALRDALNHAMAPGVGRLTDAMRALTPAEIRLCWHIQGGILTKEIARIESISPATVNKHRENIRRKLGLTNKGVNLATHLGQLMMRHKEGRVD